MDTIKVVVCDHKNLVDEEAIARAGLHSQKKVNWQDLRTGGGQQTATYDAQCASKEQRDVQTPEVHGLAGFEA
jgi:hypothetical protein